MEPRFNDNCISGLNGEKSKSASYIVFNETGENEFTWKTNAVT